MPVWQPEVHISPPVIKNCAFGNNRPGLRRSQFGEKVTTLFFKQTKHSPTQAMPSINSVKIMGGLFADGKLLDLAGVGNKYSCVLHSAAYSLAQ